MFFSSFSFQMKYPVIIYFLIGNSQFEDGIVNECKTMKQQRMPQQWDMNFGISFKSKPGRFD